MFDNIGRKIKKLAEINTIIGIGASFLGGILMLFMTTQFLRSFLVFLLGSIASWIGSFVLYGFGQLIENTDILVAESKKQCQNEVTSVSSSDPSAPAVRFCKHCGSKMPAGYCTNCHAEWLEVLREKNRRGEITVEEYRAELEAMKNER